ncbi:MAG: porin family protein [Chlorobium phaeobacteroides]|uniref:Outer surface protein, putative n=1 Tax=Chlorobium phaeobacteroides (strain BS1) TaxID=331678 RepID=B3EN38_CHLPB|nr:porin family protein [Chlorobium phaeobacteroides]
MKQCIRVCAVLLVLLVSAPLAQAATPYVSASAGLGLLADSDFTDNTGIVSDAVDYKTGYTVSGAVGLDAGTLRLEAALGYQVNDLDGISGVLGPDPDNTRLDILSLMANGYLDVEVPLSMITPYLMAGGGLANVSFDYGDGNSDDDTVLAYQLGAGVGFTGMPNVVIDLGYRYFATTDFTPEDPFSFTIASHNIVAGVRFGF